jgi:VanZ family protein
MLDFLHLKVSPHSFQVLDFCLRKLAHLTEYAIFALFLYHAKGNGRRDAWRPKKAVLCILIAALYSLTDEFHQRYVPGRGPSIVDSGIDTIGATLGMIILYFAGERSLELQEEPEGASPRNTPH